MPSTTWYSSAVADVNGCDVSRLDILKLEKKLCPPPPGRFGYRPPQLNSLTCHMWLVDDLNKGEGKLIFSQFLVSSWRVLVEACSETKVSHVSTERTYHHVARPPPGRTDWSTCEKRKVRTCSILRLTFSCPPTSQGVLSVRPVVRTKVSPCSVKILTHLSIAAYRPRRVIRSTCARNKS